MTTAAPDRLDRIEAAVEMVTDCLDRIEAAVEQNTDRLNRIEAAVEQNTDRLNRIGAAIEQNTAVMASLDKTLDVFIAQANERFNSLETQMTDFKTEMRDVRAETRRQDTRMWGFLIALSFSLLGMLSKVIFFPQV